jgi:GNAT superfamily N-acetyltransferase
MTTQDRRRHVLTTVDSQLPGEETLLGSWGALVPGSPGSHLVSTRTSWAAVFPRWSPLNNAILREPPSTDTASAAAAELSDVYGGAGVTSWALWVPSPALDLDAPDTVSGIDGMVRDTTTLVMTRALPAGLPSHPAVRRTTVEAANLAGDEPIRADALPDPADARAVDGWVLVLDEYAVAGAWTFCNRDEVGVYAVGTAPGWRRRGLAHALMLHVLADAHHRGARTASLQSTRMGQPLYAFLGFRPAGRYDEWVPAEERQLSATRAALVAAVQEDDDARAH